MKTQWIKSARKLAAAMIVLALALGLNHCLATTLAGWNVYGQSGYGTSPLAATTAAANLTVDGLTRGPGIGTGGTPAANGWGGTTWNSASEAAAITANQFATFTVTADTGYTVSFTTVSQFNYRRSGTGPASGVLQYQIGAGSFTDIGMFSYSSSSSSGAAAGTMDLSGIPDLQNVAAGTVVTFRIVNYGGTSSAGTWYVYHTGSTANDFEIQGTVSFVPNGTPPQVTGMSPPSVTTTPDDTVTLNVNYTGDPPGFFWYKCTAAGTNLIASATTATLTLLNVTGADTAGYFVVLTNSYGADTSSVVNVTVNDPAITAQPASMTNVLNDIDSFSGTVVATAPSQLLWYYNGALAAGSSFSTLTNSLTIFVTNNPVATNLAGYYLIASNQFGMTTSIVATATIAVTPPVELVRWDFNDTNHCTATNPLPCIGTGTAIPVPNPAVTNFIFANGALFDPNALVTGAINQAWELNGFAGGVSNKTAGFQFNVSTVGYTNLLLTWSERHSATASKYMRLQYTTNGTDYVDGDVIMVNPVAYQFYSSDLSAKPGVANNPNFGFRLVAEWESTAIGDTATNYAGTTSSFSGGGTIRVDLMTVFASTIGVSSIPLAIRLDGAKAILTWTDPSSVFSLQAAPQITGPYAIVSGASTNSPYTNPITGSQQFFRLKSN